ncbi:hypothetical protein BJY52DRAFT_1418433 [Lactarius psammicola]|nr:hypothetical protein BJY52DRAFT_1418433 [Lactarius psammicola]
MAPAQVGKRRGWSKGSVRVGALHSLWFFPIKLASDLPLVLGIMSTISGSLDFTRNSGPEVCPLAFFFSLRRSAAEFQVFPYLCKYMSHGVTPISSIRYAEFNEINQSPRQANQACGTAISPPSMSYTGPAWAYIDTTLTNRCMFPYKKAARSSGPGRSESLAVGSAWGSNSGTDQWYGVSRAGCGGTYDEGVTEGSEQENVAEANVRLLTFT